LTIIAVLTALFGFNTYIEWRKSLVVEQAAQELVSEIRLAQSKIIGIQTIEISGVTPFVPKVTMIRLANNANPEIYYLDPGASKRCSRTDGARARQNSTVDVMNRISSMNITTTGGSVSPPLWLIYAAPSGKFYVKESSTVPDFQDDMLSSCSPQGPDNVANVDIDLQNISKSYRIEINGKSGEITARAR